MATVCENFTVQHFENEWQNMGQDFHLDGKEWFQTLYDNEEKWVPMFVKD